MIKTMDRLISGDYEYGIIKPNISDEAIEATTRPGIDYKGRVVLSCNNGDKLKVFTSVDNARIVLFKNKYSGSNIIIPFGVDVRSLKPGDTVSGTIMLASNCGEYDVSVKVTVEEPYTDVSKGKLESITEFAILAKDDFPEAYRVFASGNLIDVIEDEDIASKTVYKGLTVNPVTYQRMDEFLTACGQKEAVHYSLVEDHAEHLSIVESCLGSLRIKKNTWGNVSLTVNTHGDFISVSKSRYLEEDFIGNSLDIQYEIDYSKLYDSVQTGYIDVLSDDGVLRFHVKASPQRLSVGKEYIRYKKSVREIMRALMDYRLGRIDAKAMLIKSIPNFNYIKERNTTTKILLLEIYFYMLADNMDYANESLKMLDKYCDFDEESAECEAAYLYLSAAAGRNDIPDEMLAENLRSLFFEDNNSIAIIWMLSEVDRSFAKRPDRILKLLEEMFEEGCKSPFLWIKAAEIYNKRPEMLDHLSYFSKFVLTNMIRYKIVKDELVFRAAFLSDNERRFTRCMYNILLYAYKLAPNEEIIEAVCKLIIKGNPRNEEFFGWFDLAIRNNIRITRLYEYYMETINAGVRQVLLPGVYRYFLMNNSLGVNHKAMLYANIVQNKNYIKNVYDEYYDKINDFAFECLAKGSISDNLAVIYSEFIPKLRSLNVAQQICNVMFRHLVICDNKKIKEVIVRHPQLKEEISYPVSYGKAYVDLYTKNAQLFFADEKGRRYVEGINYSVNNMFDYNDYANQCIYLGLEDPYLYLFIASQNDEGGVVIGDDNVKYVRYIVNSALYTAYYRELKGSQLLDYYASETDYKTVEEFLNNSDLDRIARTNHVLLAEIMINNSENERAFEIIKKYGYEDISSDKLIALCGRLIEEYKYENDEELVLLAYHLFAKGYSDKRTVKYLNIHFMGSVKSMSEIREKAYDFGIETHQMDEKILLYAMFTGTHPKNGGEILASYFLSGGDKKACEAYIVFESTCCFMEDIPLCYEMAEVLDGHKEYYAHDIVKLAMLKTIASDGRMSENRFNAAETLLKSCMKKGLFFKFYNKLPIGLLEGCQLDDKMIVEMKALSGDRVTMHYKVRGRDSEYKDIPMKEMVHGIFCAAVVMFHGDILKYRMTVSRENEYFETEETIASMSGDDYRGKSRYQRINKMIIDDQNGNTKGFYETLKKYRLAVHVTERLFPLSKTVEEEEKS